MADQKEMSAETRAAISEIVRELFNKYQDASKLWEGQAKDCALRSIIGPADNTESERSQAERYYCQAQVWSEAAAVAKRFL
ncbi:MAG: hypothetical protein OEV64_13315 [Desulfobulbaceae bacterium]|nr:hypothetical protein [Desulfobulbaceae bacterium]